MPVGMKCAPLICTPLPPEEVQGKSEEQRAGSPSRKLLSRHDWLPSNPKAP